MAFFSMLCVTLSGFVGRYFYAQIPRRVNAAELSMKELKKWKKPCAHGLPNRNWPSALVSKPSTICLRARKSLNMPMILALARMIWIDMKRPLQLSLLRLQATGFGSWIVSLGGLRRTQDVKLEHAVDVARKQAALSKRILFLSRTQQVFNLWHVVHRPFSYAFAILAIIHIGIALSMGYRL